MLEALKKRLQELENLIPQTTATLHAQLGSRQEVLGWIEKLGETAADEILSKEITPTGAAIVEKLASDVIQDLTAPSNDSPHQ